ncbi:hypothetical protein [Pararhodospirillum photometricum]|uniref:hypothetical protein n=1 Tax=Pararhodospirillum photometricum TaxID=1084 RepID=UPI0002F695F2|nr:hypothetical protein [Pararhodospirillum photometricum]
MERLRNYLVVSNASVNLAFFARGMIENVEPAFFMSARFSDFFDLPAEGRPVAQTVPVSPTPVITRAFIQESRLADPLTQAVTPDDGQAEGVPPAKVSVIVTDLSPYEPDSAILGDVGVYVEPIREIFQQPSWMVAVVGIPSRFEGRLFDPTRPPPAGPKPSKGKPPEKKAMGDYVNSTAWLPFFLVVVGPAPEVRSTLTALERDVLPKLPLKSPARRDEKKDDKKEEGPQIARFGEPMNLPF